jgi:signal transduction histidine kinase
MTTHHVFRLNYDEKLPLISADREKLFRALTNLLSNAVKYSPHGGEITITSLYESGVASISVHDEGIGIPQELLEQVFVPYYRVEGQASRYIKSSGLGLSTVREIISLHGGRVWVESMIGLGSTFYFTLPLTRY